MPSNTPSLNKLIEIIGLVSRNHRMVKDFRTGPLWDMNALKDLQTPYIWCEEAQSRITIGNGSHKTGLYTFRLYCMDRIQKDQSNYNEILSDTKFILDTIITELDQHPLFIQLGLSIDQGDVVFEPVYEETDINANGHMVEFTFRYPIRYTPCNVPIDPLAGFTYSLNNNVFNYSVVGVPGPTGSQGPTGFQGATGPQGFTGPQGPRGFQGAGGIDTFYGIFFDTDIQTNATTYNKLKYNNIVSANGVSINNNTEITLPIKGVYNIQFSAQIDKTDSGEDDIEIWLSKNGNTESWSNTRITLPKNNAKAVAAWNFMVSANANDYYEIIWQSADGAMRIYAEPTPPAQVEIPSVILSVNILSFQGPQGTQGFRGFQGFQGNTGPQGFQGDFGPQGNTGIQGETGPQGFQGDMGPQGDFGPQGETGPQGQNGQSTSYYSYLANTTDLSGDPGNGYILWDDLDPVAAKTLNISHINNDGVDIDLFLELIKSGDILILQDTTNSNRYQRYIVGDPPVLQTGYVQYDVDNQFSNVTFDDDEPITLFIITQGIQGPQGFQGFQGSTGPQGLEGAQGPQGYQPTFTTTGINSLWYNGGDLIDPIFANVYYSYSDSDGLYLEKAQLTIVEDITNPFTNKINITAETLTDDRTWTIPDSTDTFLGKSTYAEITNKKITQCILAPNNVQIKGDIYYSSITGGDLQRLGIGVTGSILGATNGIPTWITPGASFSVLTISDSGLPVFKKRNFINITDGIGVTGPAGSNIYTSGVLIPANSVSVGDVIEFRSRVRKTGTAGTIISRMYVGVNNSLTSANLIGTSATNANTTLTLQMIRTIVVKSATSTEVFPAAVALNGDDAAVSTTGVSTYNIDWTQNQFFVVSVQNASAADTSRSSFLQAKIFE